MLETDTVDMKCEFDRMHRLGGTAVKKTQPIVVKTL